MLFLPQSGWLSLPPCASFPISASSAGVLLIGAKLDDGVSLRARKSPPPPPHRLGGCRSPLPFSRPLFPSSFFFSPHCSRNMTERGPRNGTTPTSPLPLPPFPAVWRAPENEIWVALGCALQCLPCDRMLLDGESSAFSDSAPVVLSE